MSQHVGVDGAECGVWTLFDAVVEGIEDAPLEVWTWMGGGDRGQCIARQVVATDAQDVGFDPGGDQRGLGVEELGNPGGGVQGNAEPDLAGIGCG